MSSLNNNTNNPLNNQMNSFVGNNNNNNNNNIGRSRGMLKQSSASVPIILRSTSGLIHSTSSEAINTTSLNNYNGMINPIEGRGSLRLSKRVDYLAKNRTNRPQSPLVRTLSSHDLNRPQMADLDEKIYFNSLKTINNLNPKLIQKNKDENRATLDESTPNKLVIEPEGAVYVCVQELGKGKYKTTEKAFRIGSLMKSKDPADLTTLKPKIRAISLPNFGVSVGAETDNEHQLNLYLKEMKDDEKELSNVNIIKSISTLNDKDKVVITKLYHGDVNQLVKSQNLNERDKYFASAEMSKGIEQLHEIGVVHRDCKLDNFLYKLDDQKKLEKIVVTDFGLSAYRNDDEDNTPFKGFGPICESNMIFKSNAPTFDIFQLGIAVLSLQIGISVDDWKNIVLAGVKKIDSQATLQTRSVRVKFLENPDKWKNFKGELMDQISDPETKNLILRMVSSDRDIRPSIQEVREFFESKVVEMDKINNAIQSPVDNQPIIVNPQANFDNAVNPSPIVSNIIDISNGESGYDE